MTNKEIHESSIKDYKAFDQLLKAETNLLEDWFIEQVFVERELAAGTEIEFFLLDKNYNPLGDNLRFIQEINEPFLVPEIGRAHLEINSSHTALCGGCLSVLHENILSYWQRCCAFASQQGCYLAMIGTLPTAKLAHADRDFLTPKGRYEIIDACIDDQQANQPIELHIRGRESCIIKSPSVAIFGLISAFQLHIQVGLSQSVRYYNAAQAIAGPMLALTSNSPFLFGYHLWRDTRIAVFDQLMTLKRIDRAEGFKCCVFGTSYLKDSFFELFDQNYHYFPRLLPEAYLDVPPEHMYHLRRQNGIVYRWNRPVVDFNESGSPHLRIEHRGPSSGPTVVDMVANAAFFYGLINYFAIQPTPIEHLLPFHIARKNFFNAAKRGLNAQFKWFAGQEVNACDLLKNLVPIAYKGLEALGIAKVDIDFYLGIIDQRLTAKINGSEWQCRFIQKYGKDFNAMMAAYIHNQLQELPIAEWPI